MQRVLVELVGGRKLDDLAQIHHRDAVADVAHDREVVGDEQVGQPEVRLEVFEQVDDLRLDRHVERRDGLIGHDEGGLHGERAGDADPLPLAARELVRVAAGEVGVEPDGFEQLAHPLLAASALQTVDHHRLRHDAAHAHARVQRGVGVLEDHLHLPPVGAQIAPRERGQIDRTAAGGRGRIVVAVRVGAVVTAVLVRVRHDVAGVARRGEQDIAGGGAVELQDRAPGGRLAAARLADEAERLALADRERDAVHGLDVGDLALEQQAGGDREVHLEVLHFEQGVLVRLGASAAGEVDDRRRRAVHAGRRGLAHLLRRHRPRGRLLAAFGAACGSLRRGSRGVAAGFFVGFAVDGLFVLSHWRLPPRLSGRWPGYGRLRPAPRRCSSRPQGGPARTR